MPIQTDYAKEKVIAFDKWRIENSWFLVDGTNDVYTSPLTNDKLKISELYDKFKTETNEA